MSYYTLECGEKLYYEEYGSGERTLILLHGWTSSHEIFSDPVKTLSKQVRCILYDHRDTAGARRPPGTMWIWRLSRTICGSLSRD